MPDEENLFDEDLDGDLELRRNQLLPVLPPRSSSAFQMLSQGGVTISCC